MNFLIYRPLTEIEFLSRQNLVNEQDSVTTDGTMCTITPASDETFVLLGAKISPRFTGVGDNNFRVELRNNGTVLEIGAMAGSPDAHRDYNFISRGNTLDGDGVKVFDLNVLSLVNTTLHGVIIGYLRKT